MKTAAKVFIVIGMVFGCFLIFPLIFGIISLQKLNNPDDPDDMLVWGILCLIFCSLLGGIFMLLARVEYISGYDSSEKNNKQKVSVVEKDSTDQIALELGELKKQYDAGVLTEEEYNKAKAKYLKDL